MILVFPFLSVAVAGFAAKNRSAASASQSTYAAPHSCALQSASNRALSSPSSCPPSQVGRFVTITGTGDALISASIASPSVPRAASSRKKSTLSSTTSAPFLTASSTSRSASSRFGAMTDVVSLHAARARTRIARRVVVVAARVVAPSR